MPQLDGLRAVAVVVVLVHHYWPHHWLLSAGFGRFGVIVFLVMSGFLITRLLLTLRAAREAGAAPARVMILRFYGRRFLRIFPLFYATIAAMLILRDPDVTRYAGWHLSYLSNVLFWRLETWPATTSHLWSLAVEEQFYLVWPMVILLIPRRLLLPVILAAIATAPAARLALLLATGSHIAPLVLPVAVLDSLGIGALFAYASRRDRRLWEQIRRATPWVSAASLTVLVGLAALPWNQRWSDALWFTTTDTLVALVVGSIVLGSATGMSNVAGRLLESAPVVYLGRISYGMYLWHLFVPLIFYKVYHRFGIEIDDGMPLRLAWVVATFALSVVSWHLFDAPVQRLKRWLPYQRPQERPAPAQHDAHEPWRVAGYAS